MALSDSKLKSLLNKKHPKRFDIADRDGLSIRVSVHGRLTFQYRYRYRYHNKATRIALGRYPNISLEQACEKIPELRQMLNDGINLAVQLKRSKTAEKMM